MKITPRKTLIIKLALFTIIFALVMYVTISMVIISKNLKEIYCEFTGDLAVGTINLKAQGYTLEELIRAGDQSPKTKAIIISAYTAPDNMSTSRIRTTTINNCLRQEM